MKSNAINYTLGDSIKGHFLPVPGALSGSCHAHDIRLLQKSSEHVSLLDLFLNTLTEYTLAILPGTPLYWTLHLEPFDPDTQGVPVAPPGFRKHTIGCRINSTNHQHPQHLASPPIPLLLSTSISHKCPPVA